MTLVFPSFSMWSHWPANSSPVSWLPDAYFQHSADAPIHHLSSQSVMFHSKLEVQMSHWSQQWPRSASSVWEKSLYKYLTWFRSFLSCGFLLFHMLGAFSRWTARLGCEVSLMWWSQKSSPHKAVQHCLCLTCWVFWVVCGAHEVWNCAYMQQEMLELLLPGAIWWVWSVVGTFWGSFAFQWLRVVPEIAQADVSQLCIFNTMQTKVKNNERKKWKQKCF